MYSKYYPMYLGLNARLSCLGPKNSGSLGEPETWLLMFGDLTPAWKIENVNGAGWRLWLQSTGRATAAL